jgi:WD40 repeat protein
VRSIAYSPDGRFLLTGSSSPGVVVWDALSGEEIYRIERAGGEVLAIDVSPDGKLFAIGLDS